MRPEIVKKLTDLLNSYIIKVKALFKYFDKAINSCFPYY